MRFMANFRAAVILRFETSVGPSLCSKWKRCTVDYWARVIARKFELLEKHTGRGSGSRISIGMVDLQFIACGSADCIHVVRGVGIFGPEISARVLGCDCGGFRDSATKR